MHFSTVLATLSLALGATAVSQGHSGGGVNACCLNKSTIESNGVLTGLLTRGVLKNILGTSDQACAEFHVIENLNILGFTKQGTNGQCAETSAHCDDEGCHKA